MGTPARSDGGTHKEDTTLTGFWCKSTKGGWKIIAVVSSIAWVEDIKGAVYL